MRAYDIWYEVPTASGGTVERNIIAVGWEEAAAIAAKADEVGYKITKFERFELEED